MSEKFFPAWGLIRERAEFPPQAFQFVSEGLAYTSKRVHGEEREDLPSRHVTGQQLCIGLKDYAIQRYGLLARTVLERWGIRTTDDFGKIVFTMIDAGLMRKTDEDSLDDFRSVFDFDEVFAEPSLRR